MNVFVRSLAALLFVIAVPAGSTTGAASVGIGAAITSADDKQARHEAALKLAKTVQPEELVLESAARGFAKGIETSAKRDSELHVMEQRFPGFTAALVERASPIVIAEMRKSLPELWLAMAEVYAAEMTVEQIEAITDFFESSAGQTFLRVANLEGSLDPMVESLEESGEITARAHVEATTSGASKAMAELSQEELAEFARFMQDHLSLMSEVAPKIMAVTLEWMNRPLSSEATDQIGSVYLQMIEQRASSSATN